MALKKDMELWQIKSFLEDEVKEQVFLEIAPLLYIGQEVGGYFGVTRQILCLVDFLGALYCGYDGKKDKKTKRMIISEGWKAKKFIKEVLGDIDSQYGGNGEILYDMYQKMHQSLSAFYEAMPKSYRCCLKIERREVIRVF